LTVDQAGKGCLSFLYSETKARQDSVDYYIFDSAKNVTAHLPEKCLGPLAKMDELTARRLRAVAA